MGAVQVEQHGGVLSCTLDRAATLNAIDAGLLTEWLQALAAARDDDTVGAVVTSGAGDGWCVGLDLTVADRHLTKGDDRGGLLALSAELFAHDPSGSRTDGLITAEIFEQ